MTLIKRQNIDLDDMQAIIQAFPTQLKESLELAAAQKLTHAGKIANIVICGLGGSGIGGEIIREWLLKSVQVPVAVCHNYQLPDYVSNQTLVIICSYSGNTEETLSALNEAIQKDAQLIGVSSGGQVESIFAAHNFPLLKIPGGLPPRGALAYPLVQLAKIIESTNLGANNILNTISAAANFVKSQQSAIRIEAKKIVELSKRKTFVFYSEEQFGPILLRTCQQLNENSKELAFYNCVPEMSHNTVVGWAKAPANTFTVFVRSELEFSRNKSRLDFTENLVQSKTSSVYKLSLKGANLIEQTLYGIHLLDWVSYELSQEKGVDVMEVHVIDKLKELLAGI